MSRIIPYRPQYLCDAISFGRTMRLPKLARVFLDGVVFIAAGIIGGSVGFLLGAHIL